MKKITLLSILLSVSIFSNAQYGKEHTCYKRNGFSGSMKSASLTPAQILETERYDVHFYELDLSMDNLSTFIDGTGTIHGTARETLDSVLFELFDSYTITDIRLNGVTTPYARVLSAIKVPVNIAAGVNFKIEVDYNGTPPTAVTNPLGGAGIGNDTSPSWGNQVTWSLSEPFSAYEWWPCKQSLKDKADSSSVKLTVPTSCMAGSNGVLDTIVELGGGLHRFEWMHRHAIDYYLISLAIAEYVEYNVYANPVGAAAPILIQNFIYDNPATLTNFQNDIDETVDFLELYSDLFGMYPFADEKYGHCMAPFSGGMEHQTMTTQGFFSAGLTSHELGHQWWGDHVTCASWADIWVNEGFASYCEYLMKENLYPGTEATELSNWHDNVKSQPGGSTWVLDSLNESRIFSGRLTYDKGGSIIHTFRFMMNNDAAFFQALKNIQSDYGDSTIYGLDVRDEFQAASGVDLTAAFQEWYFGEGFPTYSARWNTIGADVLLEITHTVSSTTPTFTNPLEVRFTRSGAPDTTVRLDITANLNQFSLANMGNVTTLSSIDPNNWIINDVGSISKDIGFIAAVNEHPLIEAYTVSPNPSMGNYLVEASVVEPHTYVVYDLKGRTIVEGTFTESLKLDLTQEISGRYLIQLTNRHGDKHVKVLVKN